MAKGVTEKDYVKLWGILLVLLVISVCGPMLEIKWVTLITAFGIAAVKAYLVAANFMHLKSEKPIVSIILMTMLLLMAVFFFGTAADVMQDSGVNWHKKPMETSTRSVSHE